MEQAKWNVEAVAFDLAKDVAEVVDKRYGNLSLYEVKVGLMGAEKMLLNRKKAMVKAEKK